MSQISCENERVSDAEAFARIEAHLERRNELLARVDAHLERGVSDTSPEHLARGAEFEARIEEHLVRCTEVIAANGQSYDDWRFSMRQDSLRNERVLGEISQGLARNTEKLDRRTDEIIAEGKAQREALFKMLDRLDGKDDQPPSAAA